MCVNRGERANEEVSGCGRKVKSKKGKGRRRREGHRGIKRTLVRMWGRRRQTEEWMERHDQSQEEQGGGRKPCCEITQRRKENIWLVTDFL